MTHALIRSQISEGKMDKEKAKKDIEASFYKAREDYLHDVATVTTTYDQQAELRASIKQHEDNMKGIEAGWVRDNQYANLTNDTQRTAQKRTLQETDAGYITLVEVRDEASRIMAVNESTIRDAECRIRLSRYDMEFAISIARLVAGMDDERHSR